MADPRSRGHLPSAEPRRPLKGVGARAAAAALVALLFVSGVALAQGRASASCRAEIGPARAAEYVRQCREVSFASRPACDAEKSCAVIRDEIRRGCELLGSDGPSSCRGYGDGDEAEDEDEDD